MHFRLSLALLAPVLLLAVSAAQAAETAKTAAKPSAGDAFPYKTYQKTLGNGLRVMAIPYDSPGTIAFFSVVRTGSRNEIEPGHSGFAHFFEHMMFRGTDRYPVDRYNGELKRMGADSNAFTSDDYTNYYMIGPAAQLAKMMDMEADRFKNLKYSEDDFRTESLAVLGEYNKGASQPIQSMYEKLSDLAFEKHTYKHTTIGFLADVKAMPGYYDYSLQFFQRFYRPENVVVVVTGDVKPDEVFALAEKYYADWKPGYKEVEVPVEPPQKEQRRAHLDWPTEGRPQLLTGYHTPGFSTANTDAAALDLIGELLFAESAPLFQELVVDKQWVDALSGGPQVHRDPHLFAVQAQVKSPELLPEVEKAVDAAMAKLAATPVDEARLARAKAHLRYAFALGLDSPAAVGFQVAGAIALTGKVESLNEQFEQYLKVTPADIQRLARETFRSSNETVITLSHPDDEPKVPAPTPLKGGRS